MLSKKTFNFFSGEIRKKPTERTVNEVMFGKKVMNFKPEKYNNKNR